MNTLRTLLLGVIIIFIYSCNSGTKRSSDVKISEKAAIHENNNIAADGHKAERGKAHWSYQGEDGPEKWATLCPDYATCNGERQSPVDLSSALSTEAKVTIDRTYHCVSNIEIVNNGHSVQVNFKGDVVNVMTIDGKPYELKQFHFHCPSEHTLDGKHFAGEAHFVHVADDGEISVIGLFIKEGKKNELLEQIIRNIPVKPGEKHLITEEICPAKEFSPNDKYYIYEGSLTTPPCTEGVNWFVRKKVMEASKEQIETIKKVMPPHNARPVQPLNDREFGKLDKE